MEEPLPKQLPLVMAKPARLVSREVRAASLPFPPYLTTSRGILFNTDCLELLSHVNGSSVHCVFADPPFNLGKDYGNGQTDQLSDQQYLSWLFSMLSECERVLVPGGSLFVYNIPRWLIYIGSFLQDRMTFRNWIALTMKNTYPRGNTLYPAHYGLLYFTKGSPRVFNRLRVPIPTCRHCGKEIKDYGGHRDKLRDEGLNLTDFWEDTSPVRHHKFKTRVANELKPMIPERAILMSTNPGDIVLDPVGGGGSTYQMAEKNNRNWIGCEIASCDPIVERLQQVEGVKLGHACPSAVLACFPPVVVAD
jgi:site-specific DNA-methyltransferase (adenine-specific)